MLQSVPRGATCWLRIGAVRTCALLWTVCHACVRNGCGMPCLPYRYHYGNSHFFLDYANSPWTLFAWILFLLGCFDVLDVLHYYDNKVYFVCCLLFHYKTIILLFVLHYCDIKVYLMLYLLCFINFVVLDVLHYRNIKLYLTSYLLLR